MASLLRIVALATALLLALPLWAQGHKTYCCNDDQGRPVCGDVLPQACYARAYREINDRGMVVRRVAPPLTPEQLAQKEAEAERRKEEERRRIEQERREQALLQSYASSKDIDYLRDKAIADIDESIAKAKVRYDEAAVRRKELDKEMEFYKNKEAPKALVNEARELDSALKAHRSVIDSKERDKLAVRSKYDDEKRRYLEIIARQRGAAAR